MEIVSALNSQTLKREIKRVVYFLQGIDDPRRESIFKFCP